LKKISLGKVYREKVKPELLQTEQEAMGKALLCLQRADGRILHAQNRFRRLFEDRSGI